jgi:general secretion pathway protein K
VALLVAIIVVGLLVALVLPFNQKARVEVALAANVRDELKALYIAQSGLNLALAALRADTTPESDGEGDQWANFRAYSAGSQSLFNGGGFEGDIIDEDSKVNINEVVSEAGKVRERREKQLKRLFELLGLDPAKLDAVLDWLDADSDARPLGAEADWYQEQGRPVPANGRLTSLAELLQVKGITKQDYFGSEGKPGLKDVLTINSDGMVNLNTASAVVIASLSEKLDESMAAKLVAARQGKTYEKMEDITADVPGFGTDVVSDIGDLATLKSSSFLVEVMATCNEARKGLKAEVRRAGQVVGVVSMRLI